MAFQPEVRQELAIDGVTYRVAPHPAAPSVPYGQEGRQATVYQLVADDDRRALKVFKPRYRYPSLAALAERLAAFADLPGLAVCRRTVLIPQRHGALLRLEPDLIYAVLMPWINGPTWQDVLLEKREMSSEQSDYLARNLLTILATLEQRGISHGDLSGSNVLLPALGSPGTAASAIELVDVEQIYAPGLERPAVLPGSSPGYSHRSFDGVEWGLASDRFAGGLLAAEMLGWCDERVRGGAWGESYFDPAELQTDSSRYFRLTTALRERWGDSVGRLFEQAWSSETLVDCPTFGEWLVALPDAIAPSFSPVPEAARAVAPLLQEARGLEIGGDLAGAVSAYEQVLALVPSGNGLAEEIGLILMPLRERLARQTQHARRVDEARRHEATLGWQAAAALYESLLHENDVDPIQRADWEASLARCQEEVVLADLFDAATLAISQDRWPDGRAKLQEIARRRPSGYVHDGVDAGVVLASVEARLARKPPWRRIGVLAGAIGALAFMTLVGASPDLQVVLRAWGLWPIATSAHVPASAEAPHVLSVTPPNGLATREAAVNAATATSSPLVGVDSTAQTDTTRVALAQGSPAPVGVTTTPVVTITPTEPSRALVLANATSGTAPSAGTISVVAGASTFGGDKGPAVSAAISHPGGLALAADLTLYIADLENHRVRKVSPDGVIDTFAGTGVPGFSGDGGPATQAQLYSPSDVALGPDGSLYISDVDNYRVRRVTPDGVITTVAGNDGCCFSGDGGPATSASIGYRQRIAVDRQGNLLISTPNARRIRKVTPDGTITTIVGTGVQGFGGDGGPANNAQIYYPQAIVAVPDGSIVFVDAGNARVRRVATDGTITTVAGGGSRDADGVPATSAALYDPDGLASGPDGSLYVVAHAGQAVRKVASNGIISTVAGATSGNQAFGTGQYGGDGGPALNAAFSFDSPVGVVVGPDGSVYLSDRGNSRVRKIASNGTITTVVGVGTGGGDGSAATNASLNRPYGVGVGPVGSIYIADTGDNRVRKVGPDGKMSTVAGTSTFGMSGDGGLATLAQLNGPTSVAVATDGSIYIADSRNGRVRKVSPEGTITTVAGGGTGTSSGIRGTNASLRFPTGVALRDDGTVYIADAGGGRVWRLLTDGTLVVVAGTGATGFFGDGGPATRAQLNAPFGVAVAPDGTLYITDRQNHRIRRVLPDGTIATVAGNGTPGSSGDGGPAAAASLNWPATVSFAPDGRWFIVDTDNDRIRRVSQDVKISTVAGNGGCCNLRGDGGPATLAIVDFPNGAAVARDGTLLIAETGNNRIRAVISP